MYSRLLQTHQKIDKLAYAKLRNLVSDIPILKITEILHYEGARGPDSPRLYSGGKTAPWHYYDPTGSVSPLPFLNTLKEHYQELVRRLVEGDEEQSAFEAAWLAHALVDGLTPPHHRPVEAELEELHKAPIHDRETVSSHLLVKSSSALHSVVKNWKLVGPGGMLTLHTYFEANAGLAATPMTPSMIKLTPDEVKVLSADSLVEFFERYAREVDSFDMLKRFHKKGWNWKLTRLVRRELVPRMVKLVTLAWYGALCEAGVVKKAE